MNKKTAALLATPDGSVLWDSWMRRQESGIAEVESRRDKVFTDWTSMPAIEAELPRVLALGYRDDMVARALAILRWHGAAALPVADYLLATFNGPRHDHLGDLALRMLRAIHSDAAVDRLLDRMSSAAARDALYEHARRWPIYLLSRLLDRQPRRNQPGALLLQRLLFEQPQWLPVLREQADAGQLQTLARVMEADSRIEPASPDELPALLQRPPWKHRADLPAIPSLPLVMRGEPARFHWEGRDGQYGPPSLHSNLGWSRRLLMIDAVVDDLHAVAPPGMRDSDQARKALWMLGMKPDRIDQAIREDRAEPDWFQPPPEHRGSYNNHLFFWHLSAPLAAAVLQHGSRVPGLGADDWRHGLARLLRWLEHTMLPSLRRYLPRPSRDTIALYRCIEWEDLALEVARAACRNRWMKDLAWNWLGDYAATAARGLIPAALGEPGTDRDIARQVLRELDARGHAEAVRKAAQCYGDAAAHAIGLVLATAPEQVMPDTLPALPKKLFLPALPPLLLRSSGRALPLDSLPDVLMCLMLSRADAPYAGLAILQEAVTPGSLAQLGRALLAWWQDNDCPSKERWMFAVQGLIGDDETARVLGSAIRQWRAALNRVRAHDGMEQLAQIGSDTALMHLHSFAAQTRYRDLHERAQALIAQIAEARGLSREQLADRSVPDLGLDEHGALTLDFGPRRFSLHFDEALQPYVRDASGQRLKDLPKPNSRDDAVLASAAVQRYKDVKKQARSVSGLLIRRLEAAMCSRRRWTAEEFTTLLLRHPLMGHLCQRLIWGVYDAQGDLQDVVRVAEDRSLADRHDAVASLPADAEVGIAHRLDLDADAEAGFGQAFADYEILQPFEQLQREVYVLPPELAAGNRLPEWVGRSVTVASLLGLEARGWNREVGDGGMVDALVKPLGDELSVALGVCGNWFIGEPADGAEVLDIEYLMLDSRQRAPSSPPPAFAQLHPVALSELLRDLHKLAWFVD